MAVPVEKARVRDNEQVKNKIKLAATAIDTPHFLIRFLVVSMIKQFKEMTGKPPTRIHVPKAIEVAIQIDFGRTLDVHGPIRESNGSDLFGCVPVWDADEFRLD